jgi:Glycosyl hydrolases family 2
MAPRIVEVTIRPVRLTPTEAELTVELKCTHHNPGVVLRGRLTGPTCAYSTTVEVAYPIRMLRLGGGGPPKLLGRVVIPEPSWWDPESPFLYAGVAELWEGEEKVEVGRVQCGLRSAKSTPAGVWWNGRPLDLRAKPEPSASEAEWARARAEDFNAVVVPAAEAEAAWAYADRAGLLVVTDSPRPVDTFRHPSALGWLSGGELRLA